MDTEHDDMDEIGRLRTELRLQEHVREMDSARLSEQIRDLIRERDTLERELHARQPLQFFEEVVQAELVRFAETIQPLLRAFVDASESVAAHLQYSLRYVEEPDSYQDALNVLERYRDASSALRKPSKGGQDVAVD